MEEKDQQQKELFEFQKPKKRFTDLRSLFPKADFEGRLLVTLTPEQIIFAAIAVLMALVVIYAVGVEQGRRNISDKPAAITLSAQSGLKKAQSFFSTNQVTLAPPAIHAGSVSQPQTARRPMPPVKASISPVNAPYTIVAATYKSKESAIQAVSILRREGLAAYLANKDQYSVACVGAYANREGPDIQADLAKVRTRYRDAYIKSR